MEILTQNSKMRKTSASAGVRIFNFSIPAYKTKSGKITCPFAADCVKFCYAQKGNYTRFPVVKESQEKKYLLTKEDNFVDLITAAIKRKKATHIRIHDSGDFYSINYLLKWVNIANDNPGVTFYAYTKSIQFFKGCINIPANMIIIYSEGSKKDELIDIAKDRHARIFQSIKELTGAGYIDASTNDLQAIQNNKKVGLIFH
jgi:hypothetical protein